MSQQNRPPSEPPDVPTADAFIEAEVERATAPYRSLLPVEALVEMQAVLRAVLVSHPIATQLVSRARDRGAVEESGDAPRAGIPVAPPTTPVRRRGGGGA